jgi:hypothetical protein
MNAHNGAIGGRDLLDPQIKSKSTSIIYSILHVIQLQVQVGWDSKSVFGTLNYYILCIPEFFSLCYY